MALIGRLFVILFGFLAAWLVAGMIVVGAVLFPEFSDLDTGMIDPNAVNIVLGFGFIFISGFALLPAMIVVAITEAFYIRGALTYAVGGGLVGLACYLGLIPFDTETLSLRRHRPAPSRNHDRRGDRCRGRLLDDRGPQCRRLARTAAPAAPPPPLPSASSCHQLRRRRNHRRRHPERSAASLEDVRSGPSSGAVQERGSSRVTATWEDGQAFSSPTPSAKPRAMNRSGLFIALGLSLVIGLLFGIYPELDLKLAALFYDRATKTFPLKFDRAAAFARDAAMWISWGLALPAIVALVVKLTWPDRPLLMSGRAIVFLLVTLLLLRGHAHQSQLQELLGPAASGGGDAIQRRSSRSWRGGIRAAAAGETARSSPAKAPPRSGPMRPRRWRRRHGGRWPMWRRRCSASPPACCGWRSAGISSPMSRPPGW